MANKILKMLSELFEQNEENERSENSENTVSKQKEKRVEETIQLSVVTDFVRELEGYYINDLFKQRSTFMNDFITDEQAAFLKKKIRQYEIALQEITNIKNKLIEKERDCQEIWAKSSYSFYSELEKNKLKNVFYETFEIIRFLLFINVIPELDEIIGIRLKAYKESWNIVNVSIEKNTNLRIVAIQDGIETYLFGDFKKQIVSARNEISLEQLDLIRRLKIKFCFTNPINKYWIHCATITRQQLNFLKKTTVFPNDWEKGRENQIIYDIVEQSQLEYYIKAILQLLINKKDFVIISLINPNEVFYEKVKDAVEINSENQIVTVLDTMKFLLQERNGVYENNLQFAFISKKQKLETLSFCSFKDFQSNFLK